MNFEQTLDLFIIFSLIMLSLGYSAIANYKYSFLHLLIIYESMILSICIFIAASSIILDNIEGEIFILFIIAIVAAETAIAISLFIKTNTIVPNRYRKHSKKIHSKKIL